MSLIGRPDDTRRTAPTTDKQNRLASSGVNDTRRHAVRPGGEPFFLFVERMVRYPSSWKNRTLPGICRPPQSAAGDSKTVRDIPLTVPLRRKTVFCHGRGDSPAVHTSGSPCAVPAAAARRPQKNRTARGRPFFPPGTPKRSFSCRFSRLGTARTSPVPHPAYRKRSRRVQSANGPETENRSRSRHGRRAIFSRKTRTCRYRSRTSDSGCRRPPHR